MAKLHSILTANHRPYADVYADATERLAATGFVRALGGGVVAFTADDLYKKVLQLDDATEWILTAITPTWVRVSGAETGANSDITSMDGLTGALENPTKIIFPEAAAPSTPAAGKVALYAKADGLLYSKDDAGAETALGGGGGGISGLTTDVFPAAASSTTLSDSILKRSGADAISLDHATGKLYIGSGVGASVPFIINASNEFELRNSSGVVPPFRIRTVKHDQGGGSYYNLSDTGLTVGSNSDIGFATGSFNATPTTWLEVVNGNNPGQFIVKSTSTGGGGCFAFGDNSPAQITANQNDYTLTGMSKFIRLSTDASRDITGIRDPNAPLNGRQQNGEEKILVNVGSNDIVLKHQDAASTDVNRFLCGTGADITLSANQAADLLYDNTTQRWRVFKRN